MNYNVLLKSWYDFYNDLLIGKLYFTKLLEYINLQYVVNNVYPKKNQVFRPFSMTDYDKLKVVILTHEPSHEGGANGLGMGITESLVDTCPDIEKVENCLERDVKRGCFFMDYSLENWAKQGVLLLNTSLTTVKGHRNSHSIYWRPFIKHTLLELSKKETGIIYCLWGAQANTFKKYINEDNNYILECSHPSEVDNWNTSHFNDVNKILTDNNGREFRINW